MKLKPSLKPTDSIMNKLSPTTLLLALAAFTFALTAEPLSATPGLQEQMTEPDGLTVDTSAVLNQVLDHQVALNQTLDHHLVAHTSNPDLTEVTTEAEGEAETRGETEGEAEAETSGETEAASETRAKQDNDISLITDTPQEGFQLAIRLSRLGVTETQPDRDVLFGLRDAYATDPDALIASSQVIAIHFQTIAAANNYWRE